MFTLSRDPFPLIPTLPSVSRLSCQRRVGMQLLSFSESAAHVATHLPSPREGGGWEEREIFTLASPPRREQLSLAPLSQTPRLSSRESPASFLFRPSWALGRFPLLTDNDAQVLEAGERVLAGVQHLLRRFPHIAVRLLGEHPACEGGPVDASDWVPLLLLRQLQPPGHLLQLRREARCGLWIRAPNERSLHSKRCRSEAAGAAGALSGARG